MLWPDFFPETRHQFVNFLRLLEKWSRDTSRDLVTQYPYFKMLRTMSSLCVPNIDCVP